MAQPVMLRFGKGESGTKRQMGSHREAQTTRLSMRSVNRKAKADQERHSQIRSTPSKNRN